MTGDHVELDQFDSASGRDVDQFEQQIRGVKLGILRQLSNKLIEGSASPSILGLRVKTGATVGASNNANNGGFVTLQDLYKTKYLCTPTDNFVGAGPDCWVSNEKALREVLGLIDTSSRSQTIEWKFDETLGVRVPIIFGLPWYISNSVPLNETKGTGTNLTSIYALKITGATSVKILYAEDPNVPCDEWGITVYDIPIQSNQNKRLKAVVGYYALYSPENRCIVRLNGIKPTQFAL